MSIIKEHLNNITPDLLIEWSKDAKVVFASSTGENGHIELGATCRGMYFVSQRHNTGTDTEYFKFPISAVEKYKSLFK